MKRIVAYGLIALPLLSLLCSDFALANQYRCAGRVQYRPCEESSAGSAPTSNLRGNLPTAPHHGVAARTSSNLHYAKVLTPSFTRGPNAQGVWTGIIEGNGEIEMELQLKRNGRLETSWYMGRVVLQNRATTFKFVAQPPSGSNWSWSIVATAS
jgi:hypothetical protein